MSPSNEVLHRLLPSINSEAANRSSSRALLGRCCEFTENDRWRETSQNQKRRRLKAFGKQLKPFEHTAVAIKTFFEAMYNLGRLEGEILLLASHVDIAPIIVDCS
eukprot:753796-Hanusia_phi.AAC.6